PAGAARAEDGQSRARPGLEFSTRELQIRCLSSPVVAEAELLALVAQAGAQLVAALAVAGLVRFLAHLQALRMLHLALGLDAVGEVVAALAVAGLVHLLALFGVLLHALAVFLGARLALRRIRRFGAEPVGHAGTAIRLVLAGLIRGLHVLAHLDPV